MSTIQRLVRHSAQTKAFVIDLDSKLRNFCCFVKNSENFRIEITFSCFADGVKAMLEYKEQPDRVLDMHHTYTPAKYRGQGLAKQMAEVSVDPL